ncbi:uncharacterized protein LOC134856341 [Symsagittifera roscoffensis]|uniref:uncharacterized protein LOC134856341 n=1 Tax=Symsagittifera roscoffensis TaxID=84072 RepID=UPI00307B9F78
MAYGGITLPKTVSNCYKVALNSVDQALEDILENDNYKTTHLDIAARDFATVERQLKKDISCLAKQAEDMVALEKEVSDGFKKIQSKQNETALELKKTELRAEEAQNRLTMNAKEANRWAERANKEIREHESKSVAQVFTGSLAYVGAFIFPLLPPVGAVAMAAGAGSTVALGISKMSNTEKFKEYEKEHIQCVEEIKKNLGEGFVLFLKHLNLAIEIASLGALLEIIQECKEFLERFRTQALHDLKELQQNATKVGTVEARARIANDLRSRIRGKATSLRAKLNGSLLELCDGIDDLPGAHAGMRSTWNNRVQNKSQNDTLGAISANYF